MTNDRFPPGKQVQVTAKQRQYEEPAWLDQPLTVANSDEVGVLVRNGQDEARWIAKRGVETWRPPAEDSMEPEEIELPSVDIAQPHYHKPIMLDVNDGSCNYNTGAAAFSLNAPATTQALRYNEGKGEHDYLLTYPGGVRAVFHLEFAYFETLQTLAAWYRGEQHPDADCCSAAIRHVVYALRRDAEVEGHDLAAALAETNARGAAKYEVGNYLKGANYRQYCQSFIRHAQALQAGETHDNEGNNHLGAMVFNILALDMCVTQGIGTDDRIRAPGHQTP